LPANLPPQYHDAEKRLRQAKSVSERLEALEEMMAIMPKHKGTDKLRADLRTRMAKLNQEAEHRAGTGGRVDPFLVRREGAGQVVLAGLPNSGKSQLIAALTSASTRVAEYPFTTREPLPGMMEFENITIQLVDAPALTFKEARPGVSLLLRRADLALIVVDLSLDSVSHLTQVLDDLEKRRLEVFTGCALAVGTKADLPGTADSFTCLEAECDSRFPVMAVSAVSGQGMEGLRRLIFDSLDILRVYTKTPGQPADMTRPVILSRGGTIEEVAASIHKDFRRRLKYAQVWGSGKFDAQRVPRGYRPQDGDVVEFHT
jgi:hypothetical protein